MAHHHPYPLDPAAYQITVEIGRGVSAVVYKALCLPLNSTVVAIKAIDLDQSRADLDSIRRESKTMSLLSHPNILTAHCSFSVEHSLWVVMPFMSAGSLQSIIVSSFPAGLPENSIAVVLKETLCALAYLHDQGHVHRDIKAGNILIDANGSVKLGDFGVSASIYEPRFGSNLKLTDIAGTPYWMAPEVIHSHDGYGAKADIWSFGITALEAAHGRPPLSNLPPSKSLLMKITKRFRFSDYEKYAGKLTNGKKFSKSFQDMVAQCLHQDPARRPTAEKLLKHAFFKNCRGAEFLVKNVLFGLPSVEARLITAKMLRIPSMGSRSSEEGEEVERVRAKQRRISGWNFNVDGFELDPIMNSEAKEEELQETKETQEKEESSGARKVKFGGELVIPERRLDSEFWASGSPAPSPVPTPEGQGIISTVAGGSGGGLSRESMVEGLVKLRESIDEQRRSVVGLIAYFGGGEAASREEELAAAVERLKMELVSERRKNRELLMELEFLKVLMSGGSQAD